MKKFRKLDVGVAAPSLQSFLLAKVPAPASGWLPSGWWDRMPVHMSCTVTIIVLLIGLTLLVSCMMHSLHGCVQPSCPKQYLKQQQYFKQHHLHDLSQRASEIAKDQAFLI